MSDAVDLILTQWRRERPDLDPTPMGLIGRLSRVSQTVDRRLAQVFARHGLQAWGFDVLATLRRSGAPYRLRTSEIEAATSVTAGAISQRLDRLEARGFVRRERDQADKRVIHVSLTKKGRDLIDGVVAGLMERENLLLTPLNERERKTLERLLTRWLRWFEDGQQP
jgi:DNA-binding MarR family transcriptional regulator